MATNVETGFDGDDDCIHDERVVVTFPPTLGRFDESIQFGSIGWYEKTLCQNLGHVKKVVEDGRGRGCSVENNGCEVIRGDVKDEENDDKSSMHGVNDMDDLKDDVKDISNKGVEGIRDDLKDDKISMQGVEDKDEKPDDASNESDDVKSVGIHVMDEETKKEEKLNEKVINTVIELDDLKDERNDDKVTMQGVEDVGESEISNPDTEPKRTIVCDDKQDNKSDNNISFKGDDEIDGVKSAGIHVIDEKTKEEKKLNEQITTAEIELEEKTKCRDVLRVELQKEKAKLKADNEVWNAANLEIKAAKRLVTSKGQEIDYVQCVINRIKNAVTVEDINSKILEVDRMIKYETLWSKDENQFLRDIKQLKSMRDRLASNMEGQDEIYLALLQKDKIDELLKNLKKESKSLKDNVSKAEVAARAIRKKYEEKNEKGKELQAKYRAADELRQEAYGHLSNLKKLLNSKNTLDGPISVFVDEDKSVSAVSEAESEKMVSFVEEKLSDDQNSEKVESENKLVMKLEEPAKPVEIIEHNVKNELMKMEKQNTENDQNHAEMQVQKEAEQKEKARLKRLRKKEKKRAGNVTSSDNNIDIGDVLVPNVVENNLEKPQQHSLPHFVLKPEIIPQVAVQNQKWMRTYWGIMVLNIVTLVIVAALSLRNLTLL